VPDREVYIQGTELELTNHQTLVRNVFVTDRRATVRITYPRRSTPAMREILLSCRVRISYGKTGTVGIRSGKGRTMSDSVVWAQYINVTDRQTHRQPRRRSNRRPNAVVTNKYSPENRK